MSDGLPLNQVPSVKSLNGLSVMAADTSGYARRVGATCFPQFQDTYLPDADQALPAAGVMYYRTNDTTLNLPEDSPTKWGIVMTAAIAAGPQIQKFMAYAIPYREFVRRHGNDGSWSDWARII